MIRSHLPSISRKRVTVSALVVAIVLIFGGLIAAVRGARGYYELSPGTAPLITASSSCQPSSGGNLSLPHGQPCVRLMVPAERVHDVQGSLFMVDVLEGQATPSEYVLSKLGLLNFFDEGATLIPADEILGTTPSSQLNCQSDQAMQSATSSAAVVALQRLGYSVHEDDLGAQIDQVEPGTAASAAGLRCNDVVTAINGQAVHTDIDFVNKIHALKPGDLAHITVSRLGADGKTTSVDLSARLEGTPAEPGQAAQPGRAFLGVAFETRSTYTLPFDVTINVGQIGGPSAGLALTLGLLDVLSNGQLTGGHRVAATGTINLDGSVGDVGGVAQKAVAVRKAGAQVFLVPPQELGAAMSQAGSMKVYAVSTLQQALDDLQALGGKIPVPTAGQTG